MDLSKHKKARWLARQIIEAWESKSPSVDDILPQSESEDVDGVPCENILTEDIVDFIRRRDAEGLNDALQILDIEKGNPELLLPCEFLRTVDGRPWGFASRDKAFRQSRKRKLAEAIESFASPKPDAGAGAGAGAKPPESQDNLNPKDKALIFAKNNPHATLEQIADAAGVHPKTLHKSNWKETRRVINSIKQTAPPPPGHIVKGDNGTDVEAADNESYEREYE